jgi:hypothetical protein
VDGATNASSSSIEAPGYGLFPEAIEGKSTWEMIMVTLLDWYERLKTVRCLFCEVSLSKSAARKHTCPTKAEVEHRLGTRLAVYDPLEIIDVEARRRELVSRMARLQQQS